MSYPFSLAVSAASTLVVFVGMGVMLPFDTLAGMCCVVAGLLGNATAYWLQTRERRQGIPADWRRVARLDVMFDEDHKVVCLYNADGQRFPLIDQATTLLLMSERLREGGAPDGIMR